MKIGVVGCGALGSFYGAKLWQSGHEVHFLLRSDYEVVRERGVQIESQSGNFTARPHAANSPAAIGRCDVVVIGLKTTANDSFAEVVTPLVGPQTLLLTLQNGLGNEATLAKLFPQNQIFGGLCFVCLNRLHPGYVLHTGEGYVVLGEFGRPPGESAQRLSKLFSDAGIKCSVCENLGRTRWEKLIWNVPFNGLGVAGVAGLDSMIRGEVHGAVSRRDCLATDELLGDAHWESLVYGLMLEIIHTADLLGYSIPEATADKMIERTRKLGAYRASTLVDYERGQPLELDSIFLAPLRKARELGAKTPLLENLCAVLSELNRRR
jgi:2-dehydropantoate 2-reductase